MIIRDLQRTTYYRCRNCIYLIRLNEPFAALWRHCTIIQFVLDATSQKPLRRQNFAKSHAWHQKRKLQYMFLTTWVENETVRRCRRCRVRHSTAVVCCWLFIVTCIKLRTSCGARMVSTKIAPSGNRLKRCLRYDILYSCVLYREDARRRSVHHISFVY